MIIIQWCFLSFEKYYTLLSKIPCLNTIYIYVEYYTYTKMKINFKNIYLDFFKLPKASIVVLVPDGTEVSIGGATGSFIIP